MILGMDLTNQSNLDAVWPFISNTEAIAVNQVFASIDCQREHYQQLVATLL